MNLKQFFSFKGRLGRVGYFITNSVFVSCLACLMYSFAIVGIAIMDVDCNISAISTILCILGVICILVAVALFVFLFWAAIALAARRCHDIGKEGTYLFWLLVPVYNLYIALIISLKEGEQETNYYGDCPKW